jgi:hypothetical protein
MRMWRPMFVHIRSIEIPATGAQYVLSYLCQAREFMATLAANGQGMVYTIG